jgi:hypothetical protein
MRSPRRTYVVSLYDGDKSVVVEAVQRDERVRIDDLDGLAERIREWEDDEQSSPRVDANADAHRAPSGSG